MRRWRDSGWTGWRSARTLLGAGLLLIGVELPGWSVTLAAAASALSPSEEAAVRKVLVDYERAIESKDVSLFREIKPNLSADEERRLRAAFGSIRSQDVRITVQSIKPQGDGVAVLIHRRDDIDNGSLIAAFPQTLLLVKAKDRWTIQEIGK